jgi:hypothetical protein
MNDVYEIKHPQRAGGVVSGAVNCGYTSAQLASLRQHGYKLYKNGKLIERKKKNEQ